MKILILGDAVGRPGRKIAGLLTKSLKSKGLVDFAVVNGENAAGGSGLTPGILQAFFNCSVDVVTSGDHVFRNKEVMKAIDEPRLLRPINMSPAARGRGLGVFETADGIRVAVMNVLGRVFMSPSANPFYEIDRALESLDPMVKVRIVDVHAEATSEKIAMGWFLDGRVSVVFGTHTHVPTADERILPEGTAYITDVGMCGPYESVLGRDKESVLSFVVTDMPARFDVAKADVRAAGLLVDVDEETGLALTVKRFFWKEESPPPAGPALHAADPSSEKNSVAGTGTDAGGETGTNAGRDQNGED